MARSLNETIQWFRAVQTTKNIDGDAGSSYTQALNKIILVTTLTAFFLIAAQAVMGMWSGAQAGPADDSLYATGFVGFQAGSDLKVDQGSSDVSFDIDPGIAGGATLGHGFPRLFGINGVVRAEGEISARAGDLEGNNVGVRTITFFGNAWYDFPTSSDFTPYVGGGLGIGNVKAEDEDGESGFAWQLGGGVHYSLTNDIFLGGNYRYVQSNASEDGVDFNTNGHQFTVSVGLPLN